MDDPGNKKYNKNFLTLLSGNSISQIIPFIIAPILTRLFSPEDFAIYANFAAIVGLLGIIAAGRFELAFVIPKRNRHAQFLFVTSCLILGIVVLLSFLIYFFRDSIAAWYSAPEMAEYMILVPLAIFSLAFHNIQENWMLREQRYRLISSNKIIQSATNNFIPVIIGYIGWGFNGLVVGWILSNLISIVLFIPAIRNSWVKFDFHGGIAKMIVHRYRDFPTINSLHAFTDILATQFLIFWVITNEFGLVVLGLFSVMNKYIKAPMTLVSSAVSQVYYSEAAKLKREHKAVAPIQKRTIKTTLIFAIPFAVVVVFFAPAIFEWYLGSGWRMAGVYAQLMTPALFFRFITSPISGTPIIFNKQKKAYLFSVIGYGSGFAVLFLMSYWNYPFEKTLLVYSISMSMYYIFLVFWFLQLSKRYSLNAHSG